VGRLGDEAVSHVVADAVPGDLAGLDDGSVEDLALEQPAVLVGHLEAIASEVQDVDAHAIPPSRPMERETAIRFGFHGFERKGGVLLSEVIRCGVVVEGRRLGLAGEACQGPVRRAGVARGQRQW
jgi:hypothetical protein